ncbi:MAG: Y-family DNA polymerase [Patescibacteria group bacterium]
MKLFALIDCSSFYCSCERAFRPDLKDKPICVLSNNDGAVVSLTPEVKALGVMVGTPFYQVKKTLEEFKVSVFSSNYCLYADMSRRVMQVISRFSDEVEQCSIDEAFIYLNTDEDNIADERIRLQNLAETMYREVLKGTGIPVRISIAETKTLAKVGSEYAKKLLKAKKIPCVCFWEHEDKATFIENLSITDVWGVGRAWGRRLQDVGLLTARDLMNAEPLAMRKKYNVVLERTCLELKGIPCIFLDLVGEQRKSLIRSRMFGQKVTDPKLILQAVSTHIGRGAEKLRQEKLICSRITVYISTGRHAELRYQGTASANLVRATNDTFILNRVAFNLFKKCFKKYANNGELFQYVKAGVVFNDLNPESSQVNSLFDFMNTDKNEVMDALDRINKKYGQHSLVLASQGTPDKLKRINSAKKNASGWGMKRNLMSPRFTTVWEELMEVKL